MISFSAIIIKNWLFVIQSKLIHSMHNRRSFRSASWAPAWLLSKLRSPYLNCVSDHNSILCYHLVYGNLIFMEVPQPQLCITSVRAFPINILCMEISSSQLSHRALIFILCNYHHNLALCDSVQADTLWGPQSMVQISSLYISLLT